MNSNVNNKLNTDQVGQTIPAITFRTRHDGDWLDRSTEELFAGQRVVVFSLPGAFTPTCSSTHVPRYNELAQCFADNGIDRIICVSVNDAFVMEAWQQDQQADNITFIPDGNGEFTQAMGMLVNKQDLGFGSRSWRYSMLVDDLVVEKMFVEPEKEGDPFEVSDAETMLEYVNPQAVKPASVAIISRPGCPYCVNAKKLLKEKAIEYQEIVLGENTNSIALKAISGNSTVPQIFFDGKNIGGFTELNEYLT